MPGYMILAADSQDPGTGGNGKHEGFVSYELCDSLEEAEVVFQRSSKYFKQLYLVKVIKEQVPNFEAGIEWD